MSMSTVILHRVPRDLGWAQVVRAICRHVDAPVSSQTYWAEGYGDIHLDMPGISVTEARYAVELYTLTSDIEYDVLEAVHEPGPRDTRVRGGAGAVQWWGPHNSDPPRRTA